MAFYWGYYYSSLGLLVHTSLGLSENGSEKARARVIHVHCTVRSALYNWPAKVEHWPADSNGFFNGKTKHSTEYGRVFRYIFDL